MPAPRPAAQLVVVLWAAVMSVTLPGMAFAGQLIGWGEWATLAWGTFAAIVLSALPYAAMRAMIGKRLWLVLPSGLVVLLATAILQAAADYGGQFFIHGITATRVPDHSPQAWLLVTTIYLLIDACCVALFTIIGALGRIRLRERELAAVEVARLEAELVKLRLQLNPHFLCNSLNVVSSLILSGRGDEANRMTEGLADFLRATMDLESIRVSLREELETVEQYLELEGARFGERLAVRIDADAGTGSAMVPSFLLQPLIENALKHGVEASSGDHALEVRARREADELVLSVENRGDGGAYGGPARPGHGIGLANTRARLEMSFGNAASIEEGPIERGYRVAIRLPIEA